MWGWNYSLCCGVWLESVCEDVRQPPSCGGRLIKTICQEDIVITHCQCWCSTFSIHQCALAYICVYRVHTCASLISLMKQRGIVCGHVQLSWANKRNMSTSSTPPLSSTTNISYMSPVSKQSPRSALIKNLFSLIKMISCLHITPSEDTTKRT